jgi:hypothetical protein
MRVADNEHTRALGIAGHTVVIESEIATGTYSCLVCDLDGGYAGPYTLTADDLETDLDTDRDL